MAHYFFTSESVTEGHPDKICDQISDAILDEILTQDPYARVACETTCTTGMVQIMGEISTSCYVDIPKTVRDTVREIGYDRAKYGFDCDTCAVLTAIDEQSPDIALGVDNSLERKAGASDADLAIGAEQLPRIAAEYDKLCDAYLSRLAEGKGFSFFHFNVDLEGGPCLAKRVSACGAGNEYFSVVPNGDIYPCHQFAGDAEFRMGSVYEGKLDPAIRERFRSSCLFTRKKCESCFAKYICSGGCSANNYHFNGSIDEPYEITCAMMRKRTEDAMHILAERKKMQADQEA